MDLRILIIIFITCSIYLFETLDIVFQKIYIQSFNGKKINTSRFHRTRKSKIYTKLSRNILTYTKSTFCQFLTLARLNISSNRHQFLQKQEINGEIKNSEGGGGGRRRLRTEIFQRDTATFYINNQPSFYSSLPYVVERYNIVLDERNEIFGKYNEASSLMYAI